MSAPRGESVDFGTRFRNGERLLGALVRMPNEALVELAGLVGLDYVVLDTEHGPGDQLALAHHLNAAAATGLGVLVRIGHPDEALRVLDLGADGILAPHVSSPAQARDLVDAVHYPPLGRRGFASYTRAGRYGLRSAADTYAAARNTVLIAMLEDPAALSALPDIAAVEAIDGLMLGPADLACELGVVGQIDDPRVVAAGAELRAGAATAGVVSVSIVGSPAAATAAFAAGDTAVMYNVQSALGELFTGLASAGRGAPRAGGERATREPLVLLPGMLGDASVWDGVAAELLDVAVPQAERIDLDDSVPEMAATVLAGAPRRFALAGHSLGAIVAMEIMRQAPERVTRLALLNTGGHAPFAEQQEYWATLRQQLDEDFGRLAAELSAATLPPGQRGELRARSEQMALSVGPAGLRRQLIAQQGRTSYLDEVGGYRVPVLIVSGGLDDVCPPERQDDLQRHCPQAQRVTLGDAGHMAPLERPVEVAAALRTWLAR